jgi:molybdenum cofactor biosynthesis protein MoaC
MIDVGGKPETARRATAQGRIFLQADAFEAVVSRTNPKGDVLAIADLAGIQAAKRTSETLPLCHPLTLDAIKMGFTLEPETHSVLVTCTASTTAKTGVEMEALCGVNGALLCIYDLSKAVNPVIRLGDIRLNLKEGGKSGLWQHPDFLPSPSAPQRESRSLEGLKCAVITISDRCSRGEAEDRSGPALMAHLAGEGGTLVCAKPVCIPDEMDAIRRAVLAQISEHGARLILTTGGTGLSPRDVTPEALDPLWSRRIPGIGELLRKQGAAQTRMSWISRSEAGLIEGSLVISLPGSLKAVEDAWQALEPILPHALEIISGGTHR